ncbi:MAG: DUF892 family protein [Chloroflexi bacterium]|nr:DUF892 family protein [Chloroflexota bacterium]
MVESKSHDAIKAYVSDMYSLESHIEEALDSQLQKSAGNPKANAATRRFHSMVKSQRDEMKAHLAGLGGEAGGTLRNAISAVFGLAAGVVGKVRPEDVSKNLRDDYTAFNLAAMGYHMLYGTALMLGFYETAILAERHHRNYTDAIQDINQIILDVIAWELKRDGYTIDEKAMDSATNQMNEDWRTTAPKSGAIVVPSVDASTMTDIEQPNPASGTFGAGETTTPDSPPPTDHDAPG